MGFISFSPTYGLVFLLYYADFQGLIFFRIVSWAGLDKPNVSPRYISINIYGAVFIGKRWVLLLSIEDDDVYRRVK
ncbi:hypothetical protein CV_1337 [Chromobacterium violaceum ATCC 12472]|uniref:Uncharacterized protein n=1 Tax=Chromobacterium violaceum (strain ATCC 12472 / DSM 30191 / JCM 1249 / CCUG 213 / NBRC 12614 / NCIMB 9131 / NCTC 9757 / MK) TaxID=243365 RepID=Q7NYD7_CHRVO|nr:hypothetical protein CV_1337 [Chromobacterium violaceum ATCC 12472]